MTGNGLATVSASWLSTIRDQLAPGAPDAELEWFGQVCRRLNLDPFKSQIELIPRWDSRLKRKVFRPQLTVDGRRAIAARTGELRGIEGPWWTGPRDANRKLNWEELWDGEGNPYAARVFVYRKDWVAPANGTAKWDEFAYEKDGDGGQRLRGPLWKQMPAHMLGKVAESLALRRAFSEEIDHALDTIEERDEIVGEGTAGPQERQPVQPALAPSVERPLTDTPDVATFTDTSAGVADPTPAAPEPVEFVVPTHIQWTEMRDQIQARGYRGQPAKRHAEFTRILGRDITDDNQLSRADCERVLAHWRTDSNGPF